MTPESPSRWSPLRRYLPPLAVVGYVATLAAGADDWAEPRAWLAGLAALVVAFVAARRERAVSRVLGVGAAIVIASLGATSARAGLDACGTVGAAACAMAAAVAVARIPGSSGMVRPVRTSAAPWVVVVALAAWAALVARLAPQRGEWLAVTEHPRAWAVGASVVTALALLAQVEVTLRRRKLELGVAERALAMRGLLGTAFVAALVVALVGRARADELGRALVAGASVLLGAAAMAADPVRVARVTRRVVVLAIVGGGVALLGAASTEGRGDAWGVTLVTAIVALAVGTVASMLEGPLRPARGAWLDAFARAAVEAQRGDPDEALRAALHALRAPGGANATSPELWTFEPTRVTTVDAAGYAREAEGELPEALALVAAAEPEATLRADVLESLEVRRPELRPLARWMNDRGALLASLVTCDGETEGVLVLPRVARDEPPTLEEVRALADTAGRLAAACRARGTRDRMLARAVEATRRAEAAEQRIELLHHERALDRGRDALAAIRLARPATIGVYSAASRMALEALERRTAVGAPIAILAPSGIDPVPMLARAHLSGARRDGPLVLVDATSAREHDVARWTDPAASPLALAHGGMLVLLDGAALPADVQQIVARALAEKRAPWERPDPLDVQLALTASAPPEALAEQGRLDGTLAARLADARESPVALPRLRDRAEDLRAILTDRLAREGLRVLGRPVGIEHAAYARLVEYPFPGEDAELAAIVQRLVAGCTGDLIRAADVDALGLPPPEIRPLSRVFLA